MDRSPLLAFLYGCAPAPLSLAAFLFFHGDGVALCPFIRPLQCLSSGACCCLPSTITHPLLFPPFLQPHHHCSPATSFAHTRPYPHPSEVKPLRRVTRQTSPTSDECPISCETSDRLEECQAQRGMSNGNNKRQGIPSHYPSAFPSYHPSSLYHPIPSYHLLLLLDGLQPSHLNLKHDTNDALRVALCNSLHGAECLAKVDEEGAVVDVNAVRDELEPQHK